VEDDAMLQKHLSGPFAVNGGELLLGFDAVVVDAQKLALRFCSSERQAWRSCLAWEQVLR
jgi:hypothetical protein